MRTERQIRNQYRGLGGNEPPFGDVLTLLAIIDNLRNKLAAINRLSSPGSRTLDDFIRDMGMICDIARGEMEFR